MYMAASNAPASNAAVSNAAASDAAGSNAGPPCASLLKSSWRTSPWMNSHGSPAQCWEAPAGGAVALIEMLSEHPLAESRLVPGQIVALLPGHRRLALVDLP